MDPAAAPRKPSVVDVRSDVYNAPTRRRSSGLLELFGRRRSSAGGVELSSGPPSQRGSAASLGGAPREGVAVRRGGRLRSVVFDEVLEDVIAENPTSPESPVSPLVSVAGSGFSLPATAGAATNNDEAAASDMADAAGNGAASAVHRMPQQTQVLGADPELGEFAVPCLTEAQVAAMLQPQPMPRHEYQLFLRNRQQLNTALQAQEANMERLRTLKLFVLDNSLRETTVAAVRGMVMANKMRILNLIDNCGLRNRVVASFSTKHQVDDEFVRLLKQRKYDLSGSYAFSEVRDTVLHGLPLVETPIGLLKCWKLGVPNVILEADFACRRTDWSLFPASYYFENILKARFVWIRKWLGPKAQFFVNIRDFTACTAEVLQRVELFIGMMGTLPPHLRPKGLLFEDPIGGTLPSQLAPYVRAVRNCMDRHGWQDGHLLCHFHRGYGLADALVLESLAAGCTGIWCGVCEEGAVCGHSCSINTMANLARLGNKHVTQMYDMAAIRRAAVEVTKIITGAPPTHLTEIYGPRALDVCFGAMGMGDSAEVTQFTAIFGEKVSYRLSMHSDADMVHKKLAHMFEYDPEGDVPWPRRVPSKMVSLIHADLRSGHRYDYNSPHGLLTLFERAGGRATPKMLEIVGKFDSFADHPALAELRTMWDMATGAATGDGDVDGNSDIDGSKTTDDLQLGLLESTSTNKPTTAPAAPAAPAHMHTQAAATTTPPELEQQPAPSASSLAPDTDDKAGVHELEVEPEAPPTSTLDIAGSCSEHVRSTTDMDADSAMAIAEIEREQTNSHDDHGDDIDHDEIVAAPPVATAMASSQAKELDVQAVGVDVDPEDTTALKAEKEVDGDQASPTRLSAADAKRLEEQQAATEMRDEDELSFIAFYNTFLSRHLGCYTCDQAERLLASIDSDRSHTISWSELAVRAQWVLAEHGAEIQNAEDLLEALHRLVFLPTIHQRRRWSTVAKAVDMIRRMKFMRMLSAANKPDESEKDDDKAGRLSSWKRRFTQRRASRHQSRHRRSRHHRRGGHDDGEDADRETNGEGSTRQDSRRARRLTQRRGRRDSRRQRGRTEDGESDGDDLAEPSFRQRSGRRHGEPPASAITSADDADDEARMSRNNSTRHSRRGHRRSIQGLAEDLVDNLTALFHKRQAESDAEGDDSDLPDGAVPWSAMGRRQQQPLTIVALQSTQPAEAVQSTAAVVTTKDAAAAPAGGGIQSSGGPDGQPGAVPDGAKETTLNSKPDVSDAGACPAGSTLQLDVANVNKRVSVI